MFEKYFESFFLLNLKDYANIRIDFYINIFLLFAFVALGAAFFYINYYRGCMALTVKQLIRHGAESEKTAKTLSELGIKGHKGVMSLLKRDGQLTKVVSRVGATKYTYEEYVRLEKEKKLVREKIDFSSARFYLNESEKKRAQNIYENYSSSVVRTVLMCVMLLVIYFCLSLAMPETVRIVDNFIGGLING
jgi:hypothetical protein